VSREIGFAPRCADLRGFASKIYQTVENDRERYGRALSRSRYVLHSEVLPSVQNIKNAPRFWV